MKIMNEQYKPHTYRGEIHHNRAELKRDPSFKEQHPEISPEQQKVREVLNSIDEKLLRDIFAEYFQKAGSAEGSMNFVPFSDIVIVENYSKTDQAPGTFGYYSTKYGVVLVADEIHDEPLKTLWSTIHEEVHAISTEPNTNIRPDITGPDHFLVFRNSGVKQLVHRVRKTEDGGAEIVETIRFKHRINEGITEIITDKLVRQYIKSSGQKFEHIDKITNGTIHNRPDNVYDAKFYIHLISILSSVNYDVVEDALIRTYMRNSNLMPNEVVAELASRNPDLPNKLKLFLDSDTGTGTVGVERLVYFIKKHSLLSEEESTKLKDAVAAIEPKEESWFRDFLAYFRLS